MEREPSYTLWHPVVRRRKGQPVSVVCLLTPDAFDEGPQPNSRFLSGVVRELGLKVPVRGGQVSAHRSSYHGLREPKAPWQDKWPPVWRLVIQLRRDPGSLPPLKHEGKLIQTVPDRTSPHPARVGCLVIADFKLVRQAQAVQSGCVRLQSREASASAPPPMFERLRIDSVFTQLQIHLGDFDHTFFESGARYARQVEAICQRGGGITTHEERVERWDTVYHPKGLE